MQARATLLQQLRERRMWPDEMVAMACQLTVRGVDTLLDTYDAAVPPHTRDQGASNGKGQGQVHLYDTGRAYIRRLLNVQSQQLRTRDGSPGKTWGGRGQ